MSADLGTTEAVLGQFRLGALGEDAPPPEPAIGFTGQLGTAHSRLGGFTLGSIGGEAPPPGPGSDDVAARLGVVTGIRATISIEQAFAARAGVIAGLRASIVAVMPGEELVTARLGVVTGLRASISVVDNHVPLAARPGVVVGLRATIKVEAIVRARLGVIVGQQADFQRWRNVSARLGVLVALRDAYVGPGSGIVVGGQTFSPNELREGDSFNVFLPWAGLEGIAGLAQVRSRTARDDRAEQDLRLDVTPHGDAKLVPRMAGGGRPGIQPVRSDIARRVARQERGTDRIERERGQS